MLRLKIAVFALNPLFFGSVREELRAFHTVREYEHTSNDVFNLTQINRLTDWCDVAFFDFAQYPLGIVSHLACMDKPIVVRGHGLELFSTDDVNWSKISLLILTPVCQEIFLDSLRKGSEVPPIEELPIGCDVHSFSISTLKEGGVFSKKIVTQSTVIRPKKRIYTSIQMFADLLKEDPEWELHIVGNWSGGFKEPSLSHQDEYNWPIKKLIEDLGLNERIWFINQMNKQAWIEFLKDKDIFWSNSFLEGFQVSLAEAMASGLYPIVNMWHGSRVWYPEWAIHRSLLEMSKAFSFWNGMNPKEKLRFARLARKSVMPYDEKKIAKEIRKLVENV